jgi:hypothetical protein
MRKLLDREQKNELFELSNRFVNMTINGEPALLYGRLLDYPVVAQVNGELKAEYSWEAIKRITEAGGDFEI